MNGLINDFFYELGSIPTPLFVLYILGVIGTVLEPILF